MTSPLSIVLELTRIAEPDDPHAFRFEPQGYTLRGPIGGVERFDIPWSADLLEDLEALRQPGRDPAAIQRVGDVMQRALRSIGWTGLGERIRAASATGRPVFVTLRSNAAELYALPWEVLTVGASGQHLGELPGVLLRHEWPATTTSPETSSPRPEGGRVLLAWSAAGGAVPASEHQRAIAAAWSEGHVGFDPAADVLAHASAAGLAEVLAAAEAAGRPFTVLHLLAHGGHAGATFGLTLDGEDGRAQHRGPARPRRRPRAARGHGASRCARLWPPTSPTPGPSATSPWPSTASPTSSRRPATSPPHVQPPNATSLSRTPWPPPTRPTPRPDAASSRPSSTSGSWR